MFRGNYGPIKEQLEEVGVTFMPFIMKKTDHLKMATALSKYEKFDDYAPANYPSSEAVDPANKEDLSSVKINGLKDEDAQKYYDCSSIAEKGEYCVEAKLDAGQILRHRIRVPNKPVKGFLAPWDMMYIKDLELTENGMYTNAGEWGVTDVVGDDGEVYTMGYNLRILNTKISNETGPAVQNLAFTQMAGFLGGVTKAGAGQDLSFKMDPVVKYKE
ncbi:MAG: hypothetical protein ACD_73C00416G0001 [uncultured bacterium]|nr:MAG: hypothetical protein ACD_73C00416G0001 [uncultured bacterium]